MSQKNKDAIILGFALFSMFFGAGNLIFPPFLGITSGQKWFVSGIGFAITGVGLTMLGVIITAKFGGDVDALANKVGKNFAKVLGTLSMLAIGPLLAIPRTAATTYEITIIPILGNNISPIITSIVFFSITLFFVLNESSMLDRIGKILTPVLLIMVFLIIVKAIITPIGSYQISDEPNLFLRGFNEGYQTMDALGSTFICAVLMRSLVQKGYTSSKEKFEMGIKTSIIAGIGLSVVYIGLCFVGATASTVIDSTNRTEILVGMTTILWGNLGAYTLGIAMLMACLTTSIGLTAAVAGYFEKLTNGKFSYKNLSIFICVFSTITSIFGLDTIISVAVPILITLYPLIIVLMVLNIFDRYIKNKAVYKGAVFGALIISLIQSLSMVLKLDILNKANEFIQTLPFATIGMPYILPSTIFAILFSLFIKEKNESISFAYDTK